MTAIVIDQPDDMGYNDPIDHHIVPMPDGGIGKGVVVRCYLEVSSNIYRGCRHVDANRLVTFNKQVNRPMVVALSRLWS